MASQDNLLNWSYTNLYCITLTQKNVLHVFDWNLFIAQLSRVDGTVDCAPCLKLTHKTFGSQNANTDMLFLRLSIPIEFHETFKVQAGTTPLTRTLTIPEDEVLEVDPDSDYEVLKKSACKKEQEEKEKEPSVPRDIPGVKENDKDTASEKGKKKGWG